MSARALNLSSFSVGMRAACDCMSPTARSGMLRAGLGEPLLNGSCESSAAIGESLLAALGEPLFDDICGSSAASLSLPRLGDLVGGGLGERSRDGRPRFSFDGNKSPADRDNRISDRKGDLPTDLCCEGDPDPGVEPCLVRF